MYLLQAKDRRDYRAFGYGTNSAIELKGALVKTKSATLEIIELFSGYLDLPIWPLVPNIVTELSYETRNFIMTCYKIECLGQIFAGDNRHYYSSFDTTTDH
ncbi:hypothetical protein TWF225_004362 [Orbilia oligospora]|uniref:Uncharacterized protein n=1 Tax=Orbilia oligospora TaxID=2813651 RepID=A0A7C8U0E1_ORBOL|nr:hypothetical protein TWF751_007246 [Orbilia oligospora]KAF3187207.1 hypothetical protein TWF225_004362 [Orbilia oligospora]KAF3260005.1 hypothetical protein TWF217_005031 [Orbilia oligospora]KAF3267088.1 hypothetical protein TWF128_010044 [Orbilia oligospora]TGJ64620.1 hypothetical protein EYR41_010666 [Orbilia oligospora]